MRFTLSIVYRVLSCSCIKAKREIWRGRAKAFSWAPSVDDQTMLCVTTEPSYGMKFPTPSRLGMSHVPPRLSRAKVLQLRFRARQYITAILVVNTQRSQYSSVMGYISIDSQ